FDFVRTDVDGGERVASPVCRFCFQYCVSAWVAKGHHGPRNRSARRIRNGPPHRPRVRLRVGRERREPEQECEEHSRNRAQSETGRVWFARFTVHSKNTSRKYFFTRCQQRDFRVNHPNTREPSRGTTPYPNAFFEKRSDRPQKPT